MSTRPPRKYTPEYMRDGYVSADTRQAMRRMQPHLKPIDAMLVLWAPEARYDGSREIDFPAETMLKRIIDQTALGAAQAGGRRMLPQACYVEFADWAISKLREPNRRVIYAEYVHFPNWPAERKARHLSMSQTAWDRTLHESREVIFTLMRAFGFDTLEKSV